MSRYARPRRGTSTTTDSRGSPPRACSARRGPRRRRRVERPAGFHRSAPRRRAGRGVGCGPEGRPGVCVAIEAQEAATASCGGPCEPSGRATCAAGMARRPLTRRRWTSGSPGGASARESECLGIPESASVRESASDRFRTVGRPGDPVAVQRVSRRDRGGRGCTVRRPCGCGGHARSPSGRASPTRGTMPSAWASEGGLSRAPLGSAPVCASNRPPRTDRLEASAADRRPRTVRPRRYAGSRKLREPASGQRAARIRPLTSPNPIRVPFGPGAVAVIVTSSPSSR